MRNVRIGAATVLIAAAILVFAFLEGGLPDVLTWGRHWVRVILHRYSYLGSYGLQHGGVGRSPTRAGPREVSRTWSTSAPRRLERAERWFERYGVLAIIFSRHIPGFRVPITVAAGVFKIRYQVF